MQTLYIVLLSALSIFMILLILIQRGKGGGLAGAFGGMGGQSAFGTKAGDTFTRITVVVAIIWFVLCSVAVYQMGHGGAGGYSGSFGDGSATAPTGTPAATNASAPASTPAPAATAPVPPSETPSSEIPAE